ncbi:MAG: GNAT family N-acetyltransferase [Spirochaetales bacterium]|nr:GNAT family N-acetyltransferase [Spirochaetales bacterium]MBP7263662.1 GNAT family N-acetyltransferase [Spirochaetia bacterium]
MSEAIELRDYVEGDYVSLVELWASTGVGNPARGDTAESIQRTLDQGGRLVVLDSEGWIVGSAWLTDDGRRLYLHHMAVAPSLQGKGLGRMLMNAAMDTARERGMQMKLEVHRDNGRARALYESCDFAPLEGYDTMIRRRVD